MALNYKIYFGKLRYLKKKGRAFVNTRPFNIKHTINEIINDEFALGN